MNVYLSARFSRREELKPHRAYLRALGFTCESTWLDSIIRLDQIDALTDTTKPAPGDGGGGNAAGSGSDMSLADHRGVEFRTPQEIILAKAAEQVFFEITDCDLFLAFTDNENHTREPCYAEYGVALGQGKRLWIIGERHHRLHFYKSVPAFPTFDKAMDSLTVLVKRLGIQGIGS